MSRLFLTICLSAVCWLSTSATSLAEERFIGKREATKELSGITTQVVESTPAAPTQEPTTKAADAPASVPPTRAPNFAADERYAIELRDGTRIIGTPQGHETLPLDATFGRTGVPLSLIAAAAFDAAKKQVRITFRNGDTLTGTPRIDRLKLKTEYGDMMVPIESIVRMASGDKFAQQSPATAPVAANEPSGPTTGYTVWGSGAVHFDSFIVPAEGFGRMDLIRPAIIDAVKE
jgi:hypothetical protein